MRAWVFAFILGLFASGAQANEVFDFESMTHSLKTVQKHGATLIEYCDELKPGSCQAYPHWQAGLYNFKGTKEDWQKFFATCGEFENLNTLTSLTFFVAIGVEMGVVSTILAMFGGLALQRAAGDHVAPYPQVSSQLVTDSQTLFNFLLAPDGVSGSFPIGDVALLEGIVRTCSQGFLERQVALKHGECHMGCHSPRKK